MRLFKKESKIVPKITRITLDRTIPITPRLFGGKYRAIRYWLSKYDHYALKQYFAKSFDSVTSLQDFIDKELKPRNILINRLTDDLTPVLLSNPEWIKSKADYDALIQNDYFWTKLNTSSGDIGDLERGLLDVVREYAQKFPDIWRFEPGSAEKMHRMIIDRLGELGLAPKTDAEKIQLWRDLSSRGVTSVTDRIFEDVYDRSEGEARALLEAEVNKGKIWDQSLKARIVEKRMRESPEYNSLLTLQERDARMPLIKTLVEKIRSDFSEHGATYAAVLEKLSREIKSSPEESTFIHEAKKVESGARKEDLGLRVFSSVLENALKWRKSQQWALIQYLRGDIPPTKKIAKAFKVIGPERVKRMFEVLPVSARAALIDTFIDSPKGLTPQVKMGAGYSRTIVEHVLSNGSAESRRIATEVLDAFLYSLEKTGNTPLKSFVLSYLLAMQRGKSTAGETLKNVLELFGTTGIKIGQFLAASELLPPEETKILRTLQEQAKVPDRQDIYKDLGEITQGKDLKTNMDDLLGAASLKYAMLAKSKQTGEPVVLKVLRLDALAHTNAEFLQLEEMANYLQKKHGSKYGVFRSIVDASNKAVQKELSLGNEVKKGEMARKKIYKNYSDAEIEIKVPRELLMNKRLIAAEYARGSSIFSMTPEYQSQFAQKILEIEGQNLFADQDEIYFDPDRHPGNYRVEINEHGKLVLKPIDFGQVVSITRAEREKISDLFALAQILKQTGSSQWAAAQIAKTMGLDAKAASKIEKALKRYFPAPDLREVTAYFSVLSALRDAGHGAKIEYFDFIRAVIQLNQYEGLIRSGKKTVTPKQMLEVIIKKKAESFLAEMKLTNAEKLGIVIQKARIEAKKDPCRGVIRRTIEMIRKGELSTQRKLPPAPSALAYAN